MSAVLKGMQVASVRVHLLRAAFAVRASYEERLVCALLHVA